MSAVIQTHISNQLWQQAQSMIEQGWMSNMDALVSEAIRRYLESHQQQISEQSIKEDIEWGLHGTD
jgi:Arc/MetJ-type ribon-helix-helix transcriptional regulator